MIFAMSLMLLGLSPAQASDTVELRNLRVEYAYTSRGSSALVASHNKKLFTLHCGNSVKSMQVLDKEAATESTYISMDFYCQEVSRLATNLKPGDRIDVQVTTDWRPTLTDPAKMENIVLTAEVKAHGSDTVNEYKHQGDGFGERWARIQ